MPVPPLSRRAVLRGLAGAALLAAAGCTSGGDGPDTPGGKDAEPDPDLALLTTVIAGKQGMLAAYEVTLTHHQQLADRLEPLRADHAAHLAALQGFRPDLPTPGPAASASPTGAVPPSAREQAVQLLASAELATAGGRIGQCQSARDPRLARLLASIGGCEAAHTAVLRAGGS
ncbi:MAG TPA: ferritin-like domain-containing protein [Sporichthya sp.]|nr:ferritin-like domain-containing protein [Sporichthya sp.]